MKIRRTSTVSKLGNSGHVRVPIPKDVAQELGLKVGDVMLWTLDGTTMTLERADDRRS